MTETHVFSLLNQRRSASLGIVPEDPSVRRLLVRQCYPLKTGQQQNCQAARKIAMDETSRVITSDGTVIRTLLDGGTQVPLTARAHTRTHTHTHTHTLAVSRCGSTVTLKVSRVRECGGDQGRHQD